MNILLFFFAYRVESIVYGAVVNRNDENWKEAFNLGKYFFFMYFCAWRLTRCRLCLHSIHLRHVKDLWSVCHGDMENININKTAINSLHIWRKKIVLNLAKPLKWKKKLYNFYLGLFDSFISLCYVTIKYTPTYIPNNDIIKKKIFYPKEFNFFFFLSKKKP